MADTIKRLVGPAQLAAAATTVYTAPASTTTTIRTIHIVNTGASTATFTMSLGADAAGTRLFSAYPITAGDAWDWSGSLVLNAAEVLQAFASVATTLTITVTGVESA
jgi:hypothetical protein